MAPELEALYQEYKDRGFIVVAMMAEDNTEQTPDTQDLQWWAEEYGITHPLVADDGWMTSWTHGYVSEGIPTYTLLAPGEEIVFVDEYSYWDSQIEDVLPAVEE